MKNLIIILMLLFPLATFANDYEPKDVTELRAQYNLLVDLRNDEAISETVFEDKTTLLKTMALEKFQVNLEGMDLQQVVPAKRIDWIGSTLYILSALLLLALLLPLLKKFEKPIQRLIRAILNNKLVVAFAKILLKFIKRTWELIAYAALFFTLYYFEDEYIVLLASFALSPLVNFSIFARFRAVEKRSTYGTVSAWILTFLWGSIAYYHDNAFVGFIAVAAFVSAIGFAIMMWPRAIAIGFKNDSGPFVLRLTGFTFFLSLFAWILFYTNYIPAIAPLKTHLRVFEVGMVSLVPLVYFIGLGYLTFWVCKGKGWLRVLAELLAFASGAFVLTVSLMYGISSMFWIGLFFMTWDVIDKYYELIYKNIDFVWSGLILAALLGSGGYFLKNNIVWIMEQLAFLGL